MEYPTYGVKYEMKYGLHMDYKPLSLKWDAHPSIHGQSLAPKMIIFCWLACYFP